MSRRRQSWIVVMVCWGVSLWLGCGPQTPPTKPKRSHRPPVEKKVAPEPAAEKESPKPEEEKAAPKEKATSTEPSKPQVEEKEKAVEKAPETAKPKEEKPMEKAPETAKPKEEKPAEKSPEAETPKAEKPKAVEAKTPKPETEKLAVVAANVPKQENAAASTSQPPAGIPKVVMSDTDVASSLVKVGDKMPSAELPDVAGKSQALQGLLGEKATLVAFWTAGNISALQQLLDLKNDILEPYGKEGVRVVVIDEGDKTEQVKDAVEQTHPNFPILLDPEGGLFAKVATARLPRTYVLDATGRIVWFDIGYSPVMREALLQTVRAMLGKTEP